MSSASLGKDDATAIPDAADMTCAACGKNGDGLKTCTACKSAKYCDVACQKRHRKAHKKECKRLEREVKLDADVAAALDAREICDICTLPLPLDERETKIQYCCGKQLCQACFAGACKRHLELGKDFNGPESVTCPFCRAPTPSSLQGHLAQAQNGANRGDPRTLCHLAMSYLEGVDGFQTDERTALGLLQRAAELGNTDSILQLSECHREGLCGLERDEKKANEYRVKAASLGCSVARFKIGIDEGIKRNMDVAAYQFRISASLGNTKALESVKLYYEHNFLSKDDFAKTLRAYQQAHDDARSDMRDLVPSLRALGREL